MNNKHIKMSTLAYLGLAAPFCGVIITAYVAYTSEVPQSDWFGGTIWIRVFIGLAASSLIAIVFSMASYLRKEPKWYGSLITAVPAVIFIIWLSASVLGAYSTHLSVERQRQFITRLSQDSTLREELISSPALTRNQLMALLSGEVSDLLTEEQVRQIWKMMNNISTGYNFSMLINSKNTPPDILEEYYRRVLHEAKQREGHDSPRDLIFHPGLLQHPNLPPKIIKEIKSYNIDALNNFLARNPQLMTE